MHKKDLVSVISSLSLVALVWVGVTTYQNGIQDKESAKQACEDSVLSNPRYFSDHYLVRIARQLELQECAKLD
jgi:hypothetical protein